MLHIQWKDRYNINYKEIDAQHRSLLVILNEMIDMLRLEPNPETIANIFHRLCTYALSHFATEERYMEAVGYAKFVQHQAEHASFVDQLLALNQAHDSADTHLLEATLEFVKEWYLHHIIQADQDYVPALKAFQAKAVIKGIIFDFGSVVGGVDETPFLEFLSGVCGKTITELELLLGASTELGRIYESGTLDFDEFFQQSSIYCGQALVKAEFRQAYSRIFTPNESVVELIRSLKPLYKIGLIAETSQQRTEDVIQPMDVFPLLDATTYTWELGALKPSPRLLEDAVNKLQLMAEECVYVDAKGAFTRAASENYLHGVTYSTPEALLASLRRLKVHI